MQDINRLRRIACVLAILALPSLSFAATKLTVSPSNPTQQNDSTLQFTASFGKLDVTKFVKWTSSNTQVASIANGGSATLLASGTTTITARIVIFQASTALTVTAGAASLSSASLDYGNVLLGMSSIASTEIVTNSGNGALVISGVTTSGSNADDFLIDPIALPVTLQPGGSLPIPVTFTPAGAWTSGTRTAALQLTDTASDSPQSVSLSGMGVTCAGPVPASLSNGICADTDGDGLNDAWEDSGYIDLNNNGTSDSTDFHFPSQTPYVFSDVTQTGTGKGAMFPTVTDATLPISNSAVTVTITSDGGIGTAMFTYSIDGGAPSDPILVRPVVDLSGNLRLMFYLTGFAAGDTYAFTSSMGTETSLVDKAIPNIFVQYDYMDWDTPGNACTVDSDCDVAGAHPNDSCHAGFCGHNHYPSDPLFRKVVDQFAVHGYRLFIDPVHDAVPHAEVVSFAKATDSDSGPKAACAGGDIAAGNIGPGQVAVSFFDIKNRPGSDFLAQPIRDDVFHYAVFGHFNSCITSDPTAPVGNCNLCPAGRAPVGEGGTPVGGASGWSELPGNDIIVSLGASYNDPVSQLARTPFSDEGTFMHELGHNLGLAHAGDLPLPGYEPNYLSVMNYQYTFSGIQHAASAGSNVSVESLRDVDYSEHTLNTLYEASLDENTGLAPLSSGYTGIVRYFDPAGSVKLGAEAGPVDWDGSGNIDTSPVSVDLNQENGATETMVGYNDWDHGSCTVDSDCRINNVRQAISSSGYPAIDPHEPCVQNRCQSLWLNFQDSPWGMSDGPPPIKQYWSPHLVCGTAMLLWHPETYRSPQKLFQPGWDSPACSPLKR